MKTTLSGLSTLVIQTLNTYRHKFLYLLWSKTTNYEKEGCKVTL